MGNRLPLSGPSGLSTIGFERTNQELGTLEATDETISTPGYFQAMGIPLLQGRSFTEQDTTNAPMVVVVDERVARLAWPGESPIGKRVRGGVDTAFVAPVSVGDEAYTAAGSVVTEDVPPGALAIARAKQENIEGFAERRERPLHSEEK